MSYRINFTDAVNNPNGITVNDQSLNNTATDIVFVGKNYPGYAEFIGENFLHMLENFARSTPPSRPIVGQLWYDTGELVSPAQPQLKVYDGTNWAEAGSIKRGSVQPTTGILGDLWVDTTNQQLYLYTGSSWSLVGPQFNETNLTGFKTEDIIDKNNTSRTVITIVVNDQIVAIFSNAEFEPKAAISGFSIIRSGVTLSSTAIKKYWGTSEKAEALVVGNNTVPASNFLRSDVISTTNAELNVRSASGINIGQSLETSLSSSVTGTLITQKTPGRSITLQTTETSGVSNDVLILTSNKQLGINKIPTESLDVSGNILSTGTIRTTNTSSTSIETVGGAQIGGNLNVSSNTNILGNLTIGSTSSVYPVSNRISDLGRINNEWRNIYAESVRADTFTGNLIGSISGTAQTSSRLVTAREITLAGDVVTPLPVAFDGSQNIVINTAIGDGIIADKDESFNSSLNDYLLTYSANASPPLRKVSKATFFGGFGVVPVGGLMPFAGLVPPTGWLLCDGSEQSRISYPELFEAIQYTYKPAGLLVGDNTFAIPDLRGRMALGREDMDNNNLITVDVTAVNVVREAVLLNAGTATFVIQNIDITNGPFVAGRPLIITLGTDLAGDNFISQVIPNTPSSGETTLIVTCGPGQIALLEETGVEVQTTKTIDAGGSVPNPSRVPAATVLGTSGGESTSTLSIANLPDYDPITSGNTGTQTLSGYDTSTGTLGQPVDVMNPFLTLNYIIYTGV